jgi:hypothetical protein
VQLIELQLKTMTMTLHRQSDARFPGKRHPLGQLMLALYGLGISGAGLLAPAVAQAQAETAAAPAMDIQEVVVTARKRSDHQVGLQLHFGAGQRRAGPGLRGDDLPRPAG